MQAARFTVAMMMQLKNRPEIDGAEAADDAGGLAGVAQLVELEIGEHAGAPPQARVEEDRGHAGEHEGPPLPVAGDALRADEVGDQVGRVAAEKVVATIESPASHQGTERPEAKNSAVLLPPRRAT